MTRTARTKDGTIHIDGRKVAAALAQLGSFTTTWLAIYAIGITGATGFFVALGIEFVLLAGKNLVLSGESSKGFFGWAAMGIDAALNAGGLWPYVQKLDKIPTYVMFVDGLGFEGGLRKPIALVLALVFGFVLSIAPHELWKKK